jgi:NitT/TauT family transport system ATP-binding protein
MDFAFDPRNPIFKNFSADMGAESPVMILGSSGCGKTTLLHLLAGLLKPDAGTISGGSDSVSMVFQEPRLLPWKTALENVSLPLVQRMGRQAAQERAMEFLRHVSMENKAQVFPTELSGGQRQRLNLARAFACPGELLLMDEPFQSQDIPLRIELMELTRGALESSGRLTLIVTHDPHEAVFLGKRIIVLGKKPQGIIYDEALELNAGERAYGSPAHGKMERILFELLV